MADENAERFVVGGVNEVVGRQVDGSWQVHVIDGDQRTNPASAPVAEAFEQMMIAQTASSRAGNEWGIKLGELIRYAELAGFPLQDIEPEAIDQTMLDEMGANPGLKPYVENVQQAIAIKEQFDALLETSALRLETAVENQLEGRMAAPVPDSHEHSARLSIPNLRSSAFSLVRCGAP